MEVERRAAESAGSRDNVRSGRRLVVSNVDEEERLTSDDIRRILHVEAQYAGSPRKSFEIDVAEAEMKRAGVGTEGDEWAYDDVTGLMMKLFIS